MKRCPLFMMVGLVRTAAVQLKVTLDLQQSLVLEHLQLIEVAPLEERSVKSSIA